MTDLSDKHKQVYNLWLKAVRSNQNLPWQPRLSLSGLDEEDTLALMKLESFFNRHKHINISDYFNAPFIIGAESKHVPLKYYTTPKAHKAYSTYVDTHLEFPVIPTKEHLKTVTFILSYCLEHNITVEEYFADVNGGHVPIFLHHIKQRKFHPVFMFTSATAEKALSNPDSAQIFRYYLNEKRWKLIEKMRTAYTIDEQLKTAVNALIYAVDQKTTLNKTLKTNK